MEIKTKIIKKGLDGEFIKCPNCSCKHKVWFDGKKIVRAGCFDKKRRNRLVCDDCGTVFEVTRVK